MKLVNIYNSFRQIYLFLRDNEGKLEIKTINNFFPYFYEPDPDGVCQSYTGEKLRKIIVSSPSDIPKKRTDRAMEADILFMRRFLIDKVDKIDKTYIKYAFIDIEVLADEMPDVTRADKPVSCISVYNSSNEEIKTFYLGDYKSEYEMIEAFIKYMREEKFDLWLSWHVKFDYNYLVNRFPDLNEKISPIGKTRYGDGDVYYPAGISIVDYLSWFKKVTLNREKEYTLDYIAQKYLGKGKVNKPDFSKLSPDIKKRNREDVEIMAKLEKQKQLIPYFDEVRRLAKVEWEDLIWHSRILDMLLLQEAKNQKVVLPMKPKDNPKEEYSGAYRELFKSGAHFNVGSYDLSSAYPSMIFDFSLDSANLANQNNENILSIQIENIKRDEKKKILHNEDNSLVLEKGNLYHYTQNQNALLPIVVKKLLTLKINIKQKLSTFELNTQEYKNMKQKYEAIKSIVNSAYGVFGNRFFRLYNKPVAETTTYLVRDFLDYVITALKSKGYEVIYVDTDGIMIANNSEDISSLLNKLAKSWAKEKYNKTNISVEFSYEGNYEKLLLLALCRYKGYKKTEKGLEEIVRGIEAKRKDSTIFMADFQTELIEKILNKEQKENIIDWIKAQIKLVKEQPLHKIALPCRLGKSPKEYKNRPIFVRALDNTDNFTKKIGNAFYYIYVKPMGYEEIKKEVLFLDGKKLTPSKLKEDWKLHFGEDIKVKDMDKDKKIELIKELIRKGRVKNEIVKMKGKAIDVQAFDEENYEHINRDNIDWDLMKQRNIYMKLNTIFEAMDWDVKEVMDFNDKKPNKETKDEVAEYITKLKKDKQFAREVSKETRLASSQESRVQVPNLAPNILNQQYNKIQEEKEKTKILENFELKDLEIREMDFQTTKAYITKNHYSHTISSAMKASIGFYYKKELVTAIVYGVPVGRAVGQMLKVSLDNLLELVRVFSKDGLPKNTESYCIGQSFKLLKEKYPQYKYLISYADAQHGHVGYIYQATNWRYIGKQSRTNFGIFLDGKEIHPRTCNAKFGTSSKKKLKEKFGNRIEFRNYLKKHVYLMCLGNKKEKRDWYKKFPEQPYPKIKK